MYVLAAFAQQRDSTSRRRVLVVDEHDQPRHPLTLLLTAAGYVADRCSDRRTALELLGRGQHGVLVAEQHHDLENGVALARAVQEAYAGVSVILLNADGTLDGAVSALRAGVFDFMTKVFSLSASPDQVLETLRRAFDGAGNPATRSCGEWPGAQRDLVQDVLIGESPQLVRARQEVHAAMSADAPVLIAGEVGTEKVAVARFLHGASPRGSSFLAVDTAQVDGSCDVASPLEAAGEAGRVTLFFPEVSSLRGSWQVELVKLLTGPSKATARARFRVMAGLGQPPPAAWEGGVLSRLFTSLGSCLVTLPPLRERGHDVLLLAEHFAERARLDRGDPLLRLAGTALEALTRYPWPGNVDELRFAIQHGASLCVDSMIRVSDLPPGIAMSLEPSASDSGVRLRVQSLQDLELSYILRVLTAVGGNKASAARLLGVDRTTLYRKLQRQEQLKPARPSDEAARRQRK